MIERIRTLNEWGFQDHNLKRVRVRKGVKKWRMSGPKKRRLSNIKWEMFQDQNKIDIQTMRASAFLNEGEWGETVSEWKKVSEVIVR